MIYRSRKKASKKKRKKKESKKERKKKKKASKKERVLSLKSMYAYRGVLRIGDFYEVIQYILT